ncbi:MAG: hypothetical protein Tsb0014_41110 [Pleurocapsa sp.]
MNTEMAQEIVAKKIKLLASFKEDILRCFDEGNQLSDFRQLRSQIQRQVQLVRNIIIETSCLRLMPTLPPSLTGGLIIRDRDPFQNILGNSQFETTFIPDIAEMIDDSISVLQSPKYLAKLLANYDQEADNDQ